VAGDERWPADALAAELRTVLTDARTFTALLALELPRIDGLLDRADSSRRQLPEHLQEAIERLADPVYQQAARDLFPLPYSETGWPKLAARGRDAGGRFSVSYDAFRRSKEGRPSRLDEVLLQVAGALVEVVGVGSEAVQPETPVPPPAKERPRYRVMLPAMGVVIVVLVGALAWIAGRPDGLPQAGVFKPAGCDVAVGVLDEPLAAEAVAADVRSRLVSTYRAAGADESIGCPVGPAYRWEAIAVQELTRNGTDRSALLVSPNGVDLHLNNAAWGSYFQIGGKTGTAAQMTAGMPLRIVPYGDGHVEIEFTAGVVLVAERADAPYFWIPAVFTHWWRDHQAQIGLPTGNPLPTFRQDFQRAFVTVRPPQLAVPVLTMVDEPRTELPTMETIRERILRQTDGTAWFVSADGRRNWIADVHTWTCLGGDARKVARDLPGYAVASLPFGGQASCPR
jgi:hypothetical protein